MNIASTQTVLQTLAGLDRSSQVRGPQTAQPAKAAVDASTSRPPAAASTTQTQTVQAANRADTTDARRGIATERDNQEPARPMPRGSFVNIRV